MFLSKDLTDIFKSLIKIDDDNSTSNNIINTLIHNYRHINEDFSFVSKGTKDDTVLFYPAKMLKNMEFTINPNTVDIGHTIYKVARQAIGYDNLDKINHDKSIRGKKFSILGIYKAGSNYKHTIVHMQCLDDDFQILNACGHDESHGIIPVEDNGLLNIKYKPNEIKIGRFLNKVLSESKNKEFGFDFKDKEVEELVNEFKSHNNFIKNAYQHFHLVDGDDIKLWYNEPKYKSGCGILNNSCMRYDMCQNFFDIYTNDNNKVKMLILKDGELIVGRSLLWETDNGKYMDRAYCNDALSKFFQKWANDNDYIYTFTKGNSNNLSVDVSVDIERKFPYMDTFKYLKIDLDEKMQSDGRFKGILSTEAPLRPFFYLSNTNGEASWCN